jgi:hypothetical protein
MPRPVLDEASIHPAVRAKVAGWQHAIVDEVQAAVRSNDAVVVGMGVNPFPADARKALDATSPWVPVAAPARFLERVTGCQLDHVVAARRAFVEPAVPFIDDHRARIAAVQRIVYARCGAK